MKIGQIIAIGMGASAIAGVALALWMRSEFDYREVTGVERIEIGGTEFALSSFAGVDNPSVPSRRRSCFVLDDPAGAIAAGAPAETVEPLAAPPGLDCYQPAEIDADVKAGRATAILAGRLDGRAAGFERIVVIYPDGRGFEWLRFVRDGDF